MIDCNQKSTWSNQSDEFSMAVIATDKQGNALFIFTQSPYSVHNFIDILKPLPLEIYNAMYLEGSFPASFYLNYKGKEVERSGGFANVRADELSRFENDLLAVFELTKERERIHSVVFAREV